MNTDTNNNFLSIDLNCEVSKLLYFFIIDNLNNKNYSELQNLGIDTSLIDRINDLLNTNPILLHNLLVDSLKTATFVGLDAGVLKNKLFYINKSHDEQKVLDDCLLRSATYGLCRYFIKSYSNRQYTLDRKRLCVPHSKKEDKNTYEKILEQDAWDFFISVEKNSSLTMKVLLDYSVEKNCSLKLLWHHLKNYVEFKK